VEDSVKYIETFAISTTRALRLQLFCDLKGF